MFCAHCGAKIHDDAVVCIKCGCRVEKKIIVQPQQESEKEIMSIVVKVFLVLGCISHGWVALLLGWLLSEVFFLLLAGNIFITVKVFYALKTENSIGTGLKVCTLLFVSLVSGICLLCIDET